MCAAERQHPTKIGTNIKKSCTGIIRERGLAIKDVGVDDHDQGLLHVGEYFRYR